MRKSLFVVSFFLLIPLFSSAQDLKEGFPDIRNYPSEEYDAHIQNWGFAEDSNGVLYIANLQYVLRYDGVNWQQISVPNGRVYSVHSTTNGKIYVGGVDEFGYLGAPTNSETATLQYYSLRHLVPDSLELGRFFDIASVGDTVYFESNEILIRYDGNSTTTYFPQVRFSSLFRKDGNVYVREALEGLKRIEEDTLSLMHGGEYFAEANLISYLDHPQKDIFCKYNECSAYEEGSFIPMDMTAEAYLSTYYLDEAIVLNDGTLVMATRTGGIIHTDVEGNILTIFNEETGLISNTVYGVYEDKNGSVWAATINGIARIDFGIPIRTYDERSGIEESVNDIIEFQDQLISASSQGVYHWNREENLQKHELNQNCTKAKEIQNTLYVVCEQKLNVFENSEYKPVTIQPVNDFALLEEPNVVILGGVNGFYVGELAMGSFKVMYEIEDITFVPVSMEVDKDQTIWLGSKLGIYEIQLVWEGGQIANHTVQRYLTEMPNPANDNRVSVSKIKDEIVFLTWGRGIKRFDPESGQMVNFTAFGDAFPDSSIQYYWAEEDKEGNVWLRSAMEYQAALIQDDGSYNKYQGPLKLIDHRQSNRIYPDDKGSVWYATDEGIVRYTVDHSFDHSRKFHTQINEVLVRNDSLVNGGASNQPPVLNYKDNELRFTYAGASYFLPEETQYRVQLEGFDGDWGIWTTETQKDYTNIPEGEYNFKVQARNIFGVVSESKAFSFSVLPPWYRTWWAYLLYTISIGGILYVAYKIRINQLMRVQRIRNNIASDLHDEVSATLSSISYFAQAIKSDKVTGDKNRFVDLIANSAGDAKEKITDIVWAINPEHDDWQGFLSKCRRYASDLLESKDIKYSLKIDEFIPGKLDMQLRQHLWLIYKEMVTNAVRHSEAKNLDVILKQEEGRLKLVVQDDGKGMDVDGVKKGNGLVNIHKRADMIDANISLKTSEGFGTRWVLNLPL